MARDPNAIIDDSQIWAQNGDKGDPTFSRLEGWGPQYEQEGGPAPERTDYNQLFFELYSLAFELNKKGAGLDWNNGIDYTHPAIIFGSNGALYTSVASSGPNVAGGAVDPITDSSNTRWSEVGGSVPAASTTARGIVELATAAEANALTDTERAVTPGTLPTAGDAQRGLIEVATATEANALTDTERAVTPGRIPISSDTQRGLIEVATAAEVLALSDTVRAVTPGRLPASSDTQRGLVELATNAEALAGTDTTRAVTPAGVAALLGNEPFRGLNFVGFDSSGTWTSTRIGRIMVVLYGGGGGGGGAGVTNTNGGTGGNSTFGQPGWDAGASGGAGGGGAAPGGSLNGNSGTASGFVTGTIPPALSPAVGARRGGGAPGGDGAKTPNDGVAGNGQTGGATVFVLDILQVGAVLNVVVGAGGAAGTGNAANGGAGGAGRVDIFF